MHDSFWSRGQTPQWGFLENYPFCVLIDAGLGWRVTGVDAPKFRDPTTEPIRVVHMEDHCQRLLVFDVTAYSHRMRDHATFHRSPDEDLLIAATSHAAVALGTSTPGVAFDVLHTLPGVSRVADFLG